MSFDYGVSDVLALIQLSWSAVEGANKASGKNDDLTRELLSLYDVLAHVYSELSLLDSRSTTGRGRRELESHLAGCDKQLRIIESVLQKFNALSSDQKSGKQLWSKVRFANGGDQDLAQIRSDMVMYSNAVTMSLRLMSLTSRGKFERQLNRSKGSLEGIRESVNLALAQMNSTTRHKSLMIAYSKDSKVFWSRLRRELAKDGFSRTALNSKKDLILSYMRELDTRGVLGYSTSFQKAAKIAQNEAKRQSTSPRSFQSSSVLTSGRDSNSSLQSFDTSKDSGYCSSASDEPICNRTDSVKSSGTGCKSVTVVEFEEGPDLTTIIVHDEAKQQTDSARGRTSHQIQVEPQSRFRSEENINVMTYQTIEHSPSPQKSIASITRNTREIDAKQRIKIEDPQGREFSFPLSQAQSWSKMESLMKNTCAGVGGSIIDDGANILPYLWEEIAEPGAKLTIRRPCAKLSQPSVSCPPSEEFYFLPEGSPCSEDDFSHLPTLGDWMRRGVTEFTPHSEFFEMDC